MSHRLLLAAALCAASLAAAPTASGAEVQTTITGWTHAPGPRTYDKLAVTKFGPASAKTVLVLVPGTNGGRGDFTLTARELVKDVKGLQVWAVDRRSQALEDTKVFADALAGTVTPKAMFDYYAGWIADPSITPHYQPPDPATLRFAADWGLRVQLEDVRAVVGQARAAGRRVILGGHSLGASVAVAYASWDFAGRPGYKDLDGVVLIDGGLRGSFDSADLAQAKKRLAAIRKQPFLDLLGLGLPWVTGILSESAAILALKDPAGPSVGQAFPLLPAQFKPPVPATNRGELGFAFDATTSPKALGLIQVNAGRLASSGDPRDWVNGQVTPLERLARTFGSEPANAIEWYFPTKLRIDVDAVSPLKRTPATRYLGLRPYHRAEVDLPLYAMQTRLTHGRVLRGARAFVRTSRSPRSQAVYVDASRTMSHLDPLTAAPARNDFLKTVVPFLRRLP